MKRVVIVGSGGQDGTLLREQLRGKAAVVGIDRGEIHAENAAWGSPVDVLDADSIARLMRDFSPDELYYLAAYHHAAEDQQGALPALLLASLDAHVVGWAHALEAIATHAPRCRAFYASSSHVFGAPDSRMQDEATPIAPVGVYGITKAAGMQLARVYRSRGVFASSGILYNHESVLRGTSFVTQKVAAAARSKTRVRLGRLDAVVDWGFAGDTVRAMQLILAHEAPDDFVVATGVPHTVRDLAQVAFSAVGLDWRSYVEEDASVLHKEQVALVGDARKLRVATGWSPSVTFEEMIATLVAGRS